MFSTLSDLTAKPPDNTKTLRINYQHKLLEIRKKWNLKFDEKTKKSKFESSGKFCDGDLKEFTFLLSLSI